MKSKRMPRRIVTFTRIKQWLLPVDAESYAILRGAGVPSLRLHEDFIPTLRLLTQPKNISARLVDFPTGILNPYFDRLGAKWQSRPHRRATITNKVLIFETTHSSLFAKSEPMLQSLEASLRRFFSRWGYQATFEHSDSRGKRKLHVSYKYDSMRLPILPLIENTAELPRIAIDLGFTRVALSLGQKELEVNVSLAAGSEWKSMHTARCLYDQVSDVRPFVQALTDIVNRNPANFEVLGSISGRQMSTDDKRTVREFMNSAPTELFHQLLNEATQKMDRTVGPHATLVNAQNIVGNCSSITGDASNITGDVSGLRGDVTPLIGNVSAVSGEVKVQGDVSALIGPLTKVSGEVNPTLKGDLSGLMGDISGLRGDLSNIRGHADGVEGDFSLMSGDITPMSSFIEQRVVIERRVPEPPPVVVPAVEEPVSSFVEG